MKKLVSLLLALSMVITMSAFATEEKSADVKHVERVIAGIGEVTLEREKYILDAEQAYAALLEVDKELVENREDMFAARETFNKLLQQEADTVSQAIAAISNTTTDEDGNIKINLKNEETIADVEAAYEALPDAAKAMVTNHNDLLLARSEYDLFSNFNEAKERGAATFVFDGVKFSYVVDEDVWAMVQNEITDEYEPSDVAYGKGTLRFEGKNNLIVSPVVPVGWEINTQTDSGFYLTSKQNPKEVLYIQAGLIDEACLQYEEPYLILEAFITKAINNGFEHGQFHRTVYAQHRAIWFQSKGDREGLWAIILVGDQIVTLYMSGCYKGDVLTKRMVGLMVHCLNNMSIEELEPVTDIG